MYLTASILEDIRESVGLDRTCNDFDTELIMNINALIGELNQNGVGKPLVIQNDTSTWNDLQDVTQTGNYYFPLVPLFIKLKTKMLFDPPPPSAVQYHSNTADQLLWRLKTAYEFPTDTAE